MGRLTRAAAALALALASPAPATDLSRWDPLIAEGSARFGIPAAWIRRVMRAESDGRTMLHGRPITSRAGAMGLMQLMPATYREMAARYRLGPDPYAPRDNILAGAAYLRAMYERFGYPGLFAAYNAGPRRYAAHLRTGRALPEETRAYLAALAGSRRDARPPAAIFDRSRAPESLFFVHRQALNAPAARRPAEPPTLFVVAPR